MATRASAWGPISSRSPSRSMKPRSTRCRMIGSRRCRSRRERRERRGCLRGAYLGGDDPGGAPVAGALQPGRLDRFDPDRDIPAADPGPAPILLATVDQTAADPGPWQRRSQPADFSTAHDLSGMTLLPASGTGGEVDGRPGRCGAPPTHAGPASRSCWPPATFSTTPTRPPGCSCGCCNCSPTRCKPAPRACPRSRARTVAPVPDPTNVAAGLSHSNGVPCQAC